MRFKFTLRPLQLELERTTTRTVPLIRVTHRPDIQLYRVFAKRVIGDVIEENRRLRKGRPPGWRSDLLRLFDKWLEARYPPVQGIGDPRAQVSSAEGHTGTVGEPY
jgi:hypothetical protein